MRSRSVRGELPGSCPRTDASLPSRSVALEDLDRRRLAGSIGAEQTEDLALGDLEANATERLYPIIGLPQIPYDDRAGHIWPIH